MKSATYLLPGGYRLRVTGPVAGLDDGADATWSLDITRPGGTASVGATRSVGTPGARVLEDLQAALEPYDYDAQPVEAPRGY